MTHFATDNFIAGARIALHVNPTNMHAPARIDKHGKRGCFGGAISIRHRIDVGKRITIVAETITDLLDGVDDFLP